MQPTFRLARHSRVTKNRLLHLSSRVAFNEARSLLETRAAKKLPPSPPQQHRDHRDRRRRRPRRRRSPIETRISMSPMAACGLHTLTSTSSTSDSSTTTRLATISAAPRRPKKCTMRPSGQHKCTRDLVVGHSTRGRVDTRAKTEKRRVSLQKLRLRARIEAQNFLLFDVAMAHKSHVAAR